MTNEEKHALILERLMGAPPRPSELERIGLRWYESHHCGEQGYNPMLGDTCPGCHGVPADIQRKLEIEKQYRECPDYSSDLNLCRRAELAILKMGLWVEYSAALEAEFGMHRHAGELRTRDMFHLIIASAPYRVDAMVALIHSMEQEKA